MAWRLIPIRRWSCTCSDLLLALYSSDSNELLCRSRNQRWVDIFARQMESRWCRFYRCFWSQLGHTNSEFRRCIWPLLCQSCISLPSGQYQCCGKQDRKLLSKVMYKLYGIMPNLCENSDLSIDLHWDKMEMEMGTRIWEFSDLEVLFL